MTIADKLKTERKKHGYTQQQIAKQLNMTRGAYAHYETGKNVPPIETLLRLANLYKVSLDYLTDRYK